MANSKKTGDTYSTSVFTTSKLSTTIVLITSCSNNACVASSSLALVSIATKTVNNIAMTYSTYCPLIPGPNTQTQRGGPQLQTQSNVANNNIGSQNTQNIPQTVNINQVE